MREGGGVFRSLPSPAVPPPLAPADPGFLTWRVSVARSYSNTRMPGLLAPLTTPGNVVFHGVTPGVRNMTLMGVPVRRETAGLREAGERRRKVGWQVPSSLSTCIIIEHPKAVGVVMPKELPCDDSMVLLDHLKVLLVEALPEPRFVLSLLKEPRGHMANNVHLQGKGTQEGLRDNLPNPSLPPLKTCHLPKGKESGSNVPSPKVFCFSKQIPAFSVCSDECITCFPTSGPLPRLCLPHGVTLFSFLKILLKLQNPVERVSTHETFLIL